MSLKTSFREMFDVDMDYEDDDFTLSFEFVMRFGDAVLDRAERLGLRKKDIAKRAGMSASTLSKVMSGDSNPTVRTLERIAMAVGLEMTGPRLDELGENARRMNEPFKVAVKASCQVSVSPFTALAKELPSSAPGKREGVLFERVVPVPPHAKEVA